MFNNYHQYLKVKIIGQRIFEGSKLKGAKKLCVFYNLTSYLSALNADSVSMYITAPSSPPMLTGKVARTLNIIQNWVLPQPGGLVIWNKKD